MSDVQWLVPPPSWGASGQLTAAVPAGVPQLASAEADTIEDPQAKTQQAHSPATVVNAEAVQDGRRDCAEQSSVQPTQQVSTSQPQADGDLPHLTTQLSEELGRVQNALLEAKRSTRRISCARIHSLRADVAHGLPRQRTGRTGTPVSHG